jgi:acyl-CoA reductase-like NAD-dependent aldehyde dehydrogenase
VIGQVTPWNYPLNMAVWKIAPALAAGNTVVLKPAESTPLTTLLLAEIVALHTPAGTLNVVLGDRDTGVALVEHPTPQMVAITGSVRAGMAVARSAANDVKRVHLELGGKAPAIVFADASIEKAVDGIVNGAFFNGGQDCTAATRVLVHASRAPRARRRARGQGEDSRPHRRPARGRRAVRPAEQRRPAHTGAGIHRSPPRPREDRDRWPSPGRSGLLLGGHDRIRRAPGR